MPARVVALGQAAAGDDGVGFAVLEELGRRGVPAGVQLLRAADATALVPLLETSATVVLVDATVGAPPGEVLALGDHELAEHGVQPLSSHGMRASEVIGLARLLYPERIAPSIHVVAVTIARPDRFRIGLSSVVEVAVPKAADKVIELLRGSTSGAPGPAARASQRRRHERGHGVES